MLEGSSFLGPCGSSPRALHSSLHGDWAWGSTLAPSHSWALDSWFGWKSMPQLHQAPLRVCCLTQLSASVTDQDLELLLPSLLSHPQVISLSLLSDHLCLRPLIRNPLLYITFKMWYGFHVQIRIKRLSSTFSLLREKELWGNKGQSGVTGITLAWELYTEGLKIGNGHLQAGARLSIILSFLKLGQ